MVWKIEIEKSALKELEKLEASTRQEIKNYLERKLILSDNPRELGHALTGRFSGLWRYRVDKYRIICAIQDSTITIIVVKVGKRDKVYH